MGAARFITSVDILWDMVDEDCYVRDIGALRSLPLKLRGNVTVFTGENGTGKSTLVEAMAIAYGLNPEGGSRNYAFSTYDTHAPLHEAVYMRRNLGLPWKACFLRAETFYNMATASVGYESYYGRNKVTLHELSHGEALLAMVEEDFCENGLYFLDEPEAGLSVSRQLTLLYELERLASHGSQLILATHSPILMAMPHAQLLNFSNKGIEEVSLEETEAFQTIELFVHDRVRLIDRLING